MKKFYLYMTIGLMVLSAILFYIQSVKSLRNDQTSVENESVELLLDNSGHVKSSELIESSPSVTYLTDSVSVEEKPMLSMMIVKGNVSDEGGRPLPEVSIKRSGSRMVLAKTDVQGYYELELSLEPDSEVEIQFIKLGYELNVRMLALLEKEQSNVSTIDVEMARVSGTVLQGTVFDVDTQQKLSKHRVSLYSPSLDQESRIVSSDENGNFLILDIPNADDYQVRVQPGHGYAFDPNINESVVQINGSVLPLKIFLRKIDADLTPFSVNIVSGTNVPIPNIRMQLLQGRNVVGETETDAQGVASFLQIPSGEFTLISLDLPLRVSGLMRDRDSNTRIQTDVGDTSLSFAVIGEQAELVECKYTKLLWVSKQNDYTVRINRDLLLNRQLGYYQQSDIDALEYTIVMNGCGAYADLSTNINLAEQNEYMFQLSTN